jgi:3,4-dihydroxy 2-butanone 4-phosphate synthase/GTP cyclohydrolase II
MNENFEAINKAIQQLQKGGMIVLVDDNNRENEGDLVIAAEFATAEAMNFMIKKAGGIVCLSVEEPLLRKFNIGMQPINNASKLAANFTVSVDATHGITTGVSAADRARTIATLLDPKAKPDDIATPGHLFPLCAKQNGVLERRGHTEGSVDLMKIADLKPMAVICEIIDEEGAMLRGVALEHFAKQHHLPFVSIQDIVHHRLAHENWVALYSQAVVPTEQYGELLFSVFQDKLQNQEIAVIYAPDFMPQKNTLVRLHSACFTGDILGSMLCDCGEQLELGLKKLIEEKGVLIYLPQEGRGIGLGNKIKAYALQAKGMDTVEANQALGFEEDERDYAMAAHILKSLGLWSIKLLTNNPLKIEGLASYGIEVSGQVSLEVKHNSHNCSYLQTKKNKMGHLLTL